MKIQLKRSNVLSGGSAKEPTAAQMEYGELAVNYNEADPAIFIKDSNNNIIRIAGANISYDDLENLPVIGDGTITLQESNGNTIGTFTVNQTGDTDITLPEFFSGDYNDLDNLPTIGDGEITILDSEGNAIGSFTVNQEDPTEITLPAINDGVLTINAPNGDELGTFSANTDQSVEIDIPAAKWDELVGNPISIGDTEPGSPSLGDIWIDTSQCPPVMNIWDDCESPGNPIWTPIGGGDAGTPLLVNTPTLSAPTVCIGDVVTSSFGSALGGAPPYTYTYIFSNDDGVVQDSAANTYTLQASDKDKSITCVVHCVDGEADEADSNPSNPVGPVEECLTLTVGKGNITPKLGVEEGDTLTGTASVLEASNPVETHVWELDGVEVQRGNTRGLTSTYVAAAGEVRYRMEVTDDNNQSPVIGEWSDVVTVAEAFDPTKPNATMHGLRFDQSRNTSLLNSFNTNLEKFTFSCWFKPTKTNTDSGIFNTAVTAETDGSFRLQYSYSGTDGIRIVGYNSSDKVSPLSSLTLNQWSHIVATYSSGTAELRVNNGTAVTVNGLTNPNFENVLVGAIVNSTGTVLPADGYLSDVYFVDGQVLEPEVFGKSFEGRWGPLDSSDVKANIKRVESPQDSCPNYDQKWSDNTTITSTGVLNGTAPNMFDGNLTTNVNGENGTTTITFSPALDLNGESFALYTSYGDPVGGTSVRSYQINNNPAVNMPGKFQWTTFDVGTDTQINTITLVSNDVNGVDIYGIKIGDRLLIDGPADNSQVWSEGADSEYAKRYFSSRTFNKTVTEGTVNPGTIEVTFPDTGISFTKLEIVYLKNTSGGPFTVNGSTNLTLPNTGVSNYSRVDITSQVTSPLTSFAVTRSGGDSSETALTAIFVDGVQLIDGCARWNTSQTWSDGLVLSNPDSSYADTTKSFDGNLSTRSGSVSLVSNGDSQTITHTCSAIPCTSLRVHARLNTNSTGTIVAAGQTVDLDSDNLDKWYTFTGPFTDYSGLTATVQVVPDTGVTGSGVFIHAIELNGEILVDGGSFGANGFHLPFNPAAESQSWSSLASGVTTYLSSGPIGNGFDGNKNSTTRWSGSETLTIDLSTFSGSHTITIDPHQTDSGNTAGTNQVIITDANGSRTTTIPVGNQNEGASVITDNVQDLVSVQFVKNSGQYFGFYYIEIDGELLIDHSAIGTDASGQGNHFTDENFAAGNTDEVWTGLTTATLLHVNGTLKNIYDGRDEGPPGQGSSARINAGGTVTLDHTFNGVNSFAISESHTNAFTVRFNGDITTDYEVSSPNDTIFTFEGIPTAPSTITKVEFTNLTGILYLAGIFVNGKRLIDKNIQDTVKDTPMRNYAVLESGSNGNLNGKNPENSTISIGANKIYLESTAPSDLGTSSDRHHVGVYDKDGGQKGRFRSDGNTIGFITSDTYSWDVNDLVGFTYDGSNGQASVFVNGSFVASGVLSGFANDDKINVSGAGASYTVNFGQQPFAAPNVTHDWDAGTVMLDVTPSSDPTIDDSHYWSDYLTAKYNLINPTNGFDGNTATNVEDFFGGQNQDPPNGKHQLVFTPPQPLDGPVEIWTNLRPEVNYFGTWEVDTGSGFGSENEALFPSDWVEVVPAGQQLHALRMQGNHQGASFAAIKANGKMLINPPYPGPYQTLYQNWEQWARTALGYALDRIASLEQQRALDLATIEQLRTDITAALSRITSIESNEVADDAVDTVLLSTVADLITRVEALEAG